MHTYFSVKIKVQSSHSINTVHTNNIKYVSGCFAYNSEQKATKYVYATYNQTVDTYIQWEAASEECRRPHWGSRPSGQTYSTYSGWMRR